MIDLSRRTVLVTGASRGIGAAMAAACAAAGAHVLIHANANRDKAAALAEKLGAPAEDILIRDLAQPGAGTRLFAEALARGPVDALINNAGIFEPCDIASPDDQWADHWARTQAVDLTAAAELCRAAVLAFQAREGERAGERAGERIGDLTIRGRILNVASRAAHRGDDPDYWAYAAAKGGLIALTKTIARGYGAQGILAYALAPGWVATDMAPRDPAVLANALAQIPLGAVARPEEFGALAAFLLADLAPSATGSTIDANGASYVR